MVTQPGHSTHRDPGILESTLRDRSCIPDHTDRFLVSLSERRDSALRHFSTASVRKANRAPGDGQDQGL